MPLYIGESNFTPRLGDVVCFGPDEEEDCLPLSFVDAGLGAPLRTDAGLAALLLVALDAELLASLFGC